MARAPLLVLALAPAALLPATAAAQAVSFKEAVLLVGASREESEEVVNELDVTIAVNDQPVQSGKQRTEQRCQKTLTVLAVAGGRPSKVLVRYGALQTISGVGPKDRQRTRDPLAGKSFLLERRGEATAVTDDKGGAVDELTAEQVRSRERRAFDNDPTRLGGLIPKRPITIGETLAIDPQKASAALAGRGDDELAVEAMSLTLKETRTIEGARVAIFIIALRGVVSSGSARPKITLDLSGELALGIDTLWPHRVALAGPLSFTQRQGGMAIDARGRTSRITELRYRKQRDQGSRPKGS